MIKSLQKDLRTYRKDTFITSFFATITILLIVLIICSVPSHAQEINGGDVNNDTDYSYDTDNYYGLGYYFKGIDITKTNPQGCLYRDGNPTLEQNSFDGGLYVDAYNLSSSYACLDAPITLYNNILNGQSVINIPSEVVYNGTTYNIKDYGNFLLTSDGQTLDLCLFKEDTVYLTFSSANIFWINSQDAIIFNYPNSAGTGNPSVRIPAERHIAGSGVDDNVFVLSNSNHALVYANCSVLGDLYEYPDTWTRNVSYFSAEYNYLNGQTGNGGSSGSSTSETPDNNLVMTDGDWIFKNEKYTAPYDQNFPTGSVYPNGSVSFSFNPTSYQTSNPSAFELVFTFYFKYDVNYKNWNQAFSVFEETSQLLNNTKRYSHTYNYNDNGAVNIEVPLSEFISNGNTKSWTWQDIFDKLENGAFASVLANSRELYSVSYNKFDLTATAYIKSADDKSGNITEWYNPMNKKGYTTDDSGSLNKNPYVDTDSNPGDGGNAPGDAGNNGDSISSGGGVTIYNYNNNNNNGGSVSSDTNNFTNVFNKLIGDNKVTSESIAGSSGVNGFITFMNNTISSVPFMFFTQLLTFFTTCLAILVVAFVLRMLLDIL